MATFTTSCIFTELAPNAGYKEIIIETPHSLFIGGTDEIQVTLTDHGIVAGGLLSINGYEMSGTYGVIRTEAPTTFVAAGVLTISGISTITHPAKKIYRIIGKSA